MPPRECAKTRSAVPYATAWTRRRATLARMGLLALVAPGGCDRLTAILEEKAQEVAEEMAPPEEAAPPAGPVLSEDQQLAAKLVLYTECQGRASRRIRQSWQRYQEHVQEDGTPRSGHAGAGKDAKPRKPFLYEIDGELTPCEEAVTKGPTLPPPLPELEKTMATWLTHAKAFADIVGSKYCATRVYDHSALRHELSSQRNILRNNKVAGYCMRDNIFVSLIGSSRY